MLRRETAETINDNGNVLLRRGEDASLSSQLHHPGEASKNETALLPGDAALQLVPGLHMLWWAGGAFPDRMFSSNFASERRIEWRC